MKRPKKTSAWSNGAFEVFWAAPSSISKLQAAGLSWKPRTPIGRPWVRWSKDVYVQGETCVCRIKSIRTEMSFLQTTRMRVPEPSHAFPDLPRSSHRSALRNLDAAQLTLSNISDNTVQVILSLPSQSHLRWPWVTNTYKTIQRASNAKRTHKTHKTGVCYKVERLSDRSVASIELEVRISVSVNVKPIHRKPQSQQLCLYVLTS